MRSLLYAGLSLLILLTAFAPISIAGANPASNSVLIVADNRYYGGAGQYRDRAPYGRYNAYSNRPGNYTNFESAAPRRYRMDSADRARNNLGYQNVYSYGNRQYNDNRDQSHQIRRLGELINESSECSDGRK